MKKFASLLLVLALFVSVACAAEIPANKTSQEINAYAAYATTAPVIDGEIDEIWAATQEIETLNEYDPDSIQAFGKIKVLWDEGNLYFLAVVTDPTVAESAADSTTNCVNFWVSETNQGTEAFAEAGDYAFIINQAGNIGYYTGNEAVREKGVAVTKIYADEETPYYVVEAMMPALTEGLTFADGHLIGFEISVDDDVDGDNARDVYCNWVGVAGYWSMPYTLPNVQLVKELPAQ